jgi:transposase InsO family protein
MNIAGQRSAIVFTLSEKRSSIMKRADQYLRIRVLGAVEGMSGKTCIEKIKKASELVYEDEQGNRYKFTWRTISTWYYRYKIGGITSMEPKRRSDRGIARKSSPEEVLEAINEAKQFFKPDIIPPRSALYRMCIEKGLLRAEEVGRTTFYRFIHQFNLLDAEEEKSTRRLAFAMPHANDLWQVDTMYGPYVTHNGRKEQSYLIAFIDDASRVLCHVQFFASENVHSMSICLRNALYKRGIPKAIYADNGSIYCSAELNLVCARIGCILRHTPVRDGASKGKIERFFRTVREQFLIRNLDLSSMENLNRQFNEWVEKDYNSTIHSVLRMTPLDRYYLDRRMIRFLPPSEDNDELFYKEEPRKVGKDNTIRCHGERYEVPVELAGKSVIIRFPRDTKDKIIVYYKEERMGEAKLVDLHANAFMKRPGKEKLS